MQQKNFLLFIILSFLLFVAWMETKHRLWPQKPISAPVEVTKEPPPKPQTIASVLGLTAGPASPWLIAADALARTVPLKPKPIEPPARPSVTPEAQILTLGSNDRTSTFHLQVKFDPRGASVRRVVLNKFQQASPVGRPELQGDMPVPLSLVPKSPNVENPSYQLFLYDPDHPTDNRPLDTLGNVVWEVVKKDGEAAVEDKTEDGRPRWTITFKTEVKEWGLEIFKKYSLAEGEYHVGLEVQFQLKDKKELKLRYQMTGAHGLPIEGHWYTSVFRNSLIALEKDGRIYERDLQDLRQIDLWQGGNEVKRQQGQVLRYAAVVVQYFASAIVVDDNQKDQTFLERARPTEETAVFRGAVKSVNQETGTLTLDRPFRGRSVGGVLSFKAGHVPELASGDASRHRLQHRQPGPGDCF